MEYSSGYSSYLYYENIENILILVLIVSAGSKLPMHKHQGRIKKQQKEAAIKKKIDDRHFTFSATYMLPQRGGGKAITDV